MSLSAMDGASWTWYRRLSPVKPAGHASKFRNNHTGGRRFVAKVRYASCPVGLCRATRLERYLPRGRRIARASWQAMGRPWALVRAAPVPESCVLDSGGVHEDLRLRLIDRVRVLERSGNLLPRGVPGAARPRARDSFLRAGHLRPAGQSRPGNR